MVKINITNKKHLNLLFPQWQGGGRDSAAYDGALELRRYYLGETEVSEVEVSRSPIGAMRNNIIGYDDILLQLKRARRIIETEQPETSFTIGAGCDADVMSISYMNAKTNGNMTLVWIDAHGDIHTPDSSETKRFYGMPIRVLLGEGDNAILSLMFSKLQTSQLVMLGVRDLDKAEKVYIPGQNISIYKVVDVENNMGAIIDAIRAKGQANIYVHIDLDVLEPSEFPSVRLPVPGGLKLKTLMQLLKILEKEFNIVGMGLFEYVPSGGRRYELLEYIAGIGTCLKGQIK
jgi:arginase